MARAWALALGVSLGLGLLWWLLLPPWTAPDEPGHYLYARQLASRSQLSQQQEINELESGILASLALHDWWVYHELPHPAQLPQRLAAEPLLAASGVQATHNPPAFYVLPALWLRFHDPENEQEPGQTLRLLRLWSLTVRLVAVAATLALARRLWPHAPGRASGLGLLVGALPMVAFTAGSFNNGALALTWGAISFALLAWPGSSRIRIALLLLALVAGPLLIDRSLLFLWPLAGVWALFVWPPLRPYRRHIVLGLALAAILMALPNPRWAAGWRRLPALTPSRAPDGLTLQPQPGQTAQLSQALSGKQLLGLRDQPLQLEAAIISGASPSLTLRMTDDERTTTMTCHTLAACTLPFTPSRQATRLVITAAANEPLVFTLRLRAPGSDELLFNGDGRLSDFSGSPLLAGLERNLPVPAGYFSGLLNPAAWDAPSCFRYLAFVGFTAASFWGYFGWLSRPFPWPVYLLLAASTLAALGGVFHYGLAALQRWRGQTLTPDDRLVALALLAVGLILTQTWMPMFGQDWQPQGRYLFPALLPLALLLLIGCENALPLRWRPRLPLLLAAALLLLNLLSWTIVAV